MHEQKNLRVCIWVNLSSSQRGFRDTNRYYLDSKWAVWVTYEDRCAKLQTGLQFGMLLGMLLLLQRNEKKHMLVLALLASVYLCTSELASKPPRTPELGKTFLKTRANYTAG